MFCSAGEYVGDAIDQGVISTTIFVCDRSDKGAEDCGGSEAGNIKACNVGLFKSIGGIKGVHIGALDPVCGDGEKIDEEVVELECAEGGVTCRWGGGVFAGVGRVGLAGEEMGGDGD